MKHLNCITGHDIVANSKIRNYLQVYWKVLPFLDTIKIDHFLFFLSFSFTYGKQNHNNLYNLISILLKLFNVNFFKLLNWGRPEFS